MSSANHLTNQAFLYVRSECTLLKVTALQQMHVCRMEDLVQAVGTSECSLIAAVSQQVEPLKVIHLALNDVGVVCSPAPLASGFLDFLLALTCLPPSCWLGSGRLWLCTSLL